MFSKIELLQICEVLQASFLICECKGTDFWHTHQIFGEEILEKFSGISLETGVTRWMPARCGVQKKSRNFALSGGGHARLCPLAGKSADLPVRRRAGNFMSNGANVGFTCVYAKFWGEYFAGLCWRTCFSRIWGQVANAEDWRAGAEAGFGSR